MTKRWVAVLWIAGLLGGKIVSAERFVLTPAAISIALSASGVPISEQQVTMPTEVVASVADPVLAVRSMERGRGQVTRVRISCRNAGECLPFYVSVRSDDVITREIAEQASQKALMRRPESTIGAKVRSPVVIRAGSHAVMLIDDEHLHMRLPVVCLESGDLGAVIRVASGDHKQMYRAEVLDGSSLKGRL